jgi:hypothetical protein
VFDCPLELGDGASGDGDLPLSGLFYSFSVAEGTYLSTTVTACGSAFDTKLWLFDSAGNDIGYNDDGCSGFGSGSNYASNLEFANGLAAGSYVALLTPYSSWTSVTTWNLSASSVLVVEGCMDQTADNYDPAANVDDDSCTFSQVPGCTDVAACNYDADAEVDDGTCELPGDTCSCSDSDGSSTCDEMYGWGDFTETCSAADGNGATLTWSETGGVPYQVIYGWSDCDGPFVIKSPTTDIPSQSDHP